MKKPALLLILLIQLFGSVSKSQTTHLDSMLLMVDAIYDTIDYSGMQTSNFFNRGFLIGAPFEEWNQSSAMIFNYTDFDEYRTPIMRTNNTLNIPEVDSLMEEYNDIYYQDESVSTIAVPVIFMKGEYALDSNVQLYFDSSQTLVFKKFNFLCATPLAQLVSQGSVKYKFHPDIIYSTDAITHLAVDFDDGNGFQTIGTTAEQIEAVNYTTPGEKNLIFRVVDSLGDTTISYSYLEVLSVTSIFEGAYYGIITDTTDTTGVPPGSRSFYANFGLDYLYYPGVDSKHNKPFIFVEGFDLFNNNAVRVSAARMLGYIPSLQLAGYDVYITNFRDGRGDVFSNANYLKHFIRYVVHKKSPFGVNYIENHEGAVFCLSMGGIISRIALKQLENSGYDHRIGTLIMSDTPHKGANLGLYIQKGFTDLTNSIAPWILRSLNWMGVFSPFVDNARYLPGASAVYDAVNSTAALQLLVQHLNPASLGMHSNLINYLDNLGWPQNVRKVGLVCGSNRGIDQGYLPGDKLVDSRIWIPIIGFYDFWGKASPLNVSNFPYWRMFYSGNFILPPSLSYGFWNFGDKPWDSAPGSKLIVIENDFISQQVDIPMMVSPLSVMDVTNSYFTGSNFYSYNRNLSKGKSYFFNNNLTPLDEVYSINVVGEENMEHPWVYQEAIIRDIVLDQELMVTDYYLQNRTFDKDRDIECGGDMVVGNNILAPKSNYLYNRGNHDPLLSTSETKKTVPVGNIVIKSGTNLLLEAKSSVLLKPGFKAENGSKIQIKVDGTNPNSRSTKDISKCGKIVRSNNGSGIVGFRYSYDVNVAWVLKGYSCKKQYFGNEIEIPSGLTKGQYSLEISVSGCKIPSIVFDIRQKKEEQNKYSKKDFKYPFDSWIISPNPSNKYVDIDSKTPFEAITICSQFGNVIYQQKFNHNALNAKQIDVSDLASGTYLISIEFKNGTFETKRLVIQH